MATVSGRKMTAGEREGKKTWYCQNDGSELSEKQSSDPTGSIACPKCDQSWWATTPPAKDDVEERQAAMKRAKDARAEAFKAAGVKDPDGSDK